MILLFDNVYLYVLFVIAVSVLVTTSVFIVMNMLFASRVRRDEY